MKWLALLGLMLAITIQPASASASPDTDSLPTIDRLLMASQIYSAIQMYFGHWKGVPDLNLDSEYERYLQQVLSSECRHEFDLTTMEFLAKLQNSHSGFGDPWLRSNFGQRLGFSAYPIDGQWVISRSSIPGLKPGDALAKIDDETFPAFYQRIRKYVSASDERWRQRAIFEEPYLFPEVFRLTLGDGRSIQIRRQGEFQWPGEEFSTIETTERDGVAILRIPSFDKSVFEDSAVEYLRKLGSVRAVVLDLRGNHGGSTPERLVEALMDRPYRYWSESTPATIGVLQVENGAGARTELTWTSSHQNPSPTAYTGPLYILVDGGCFSACEDAVVPFKDNHRAMILGERTGGSSGQPYSRNLKYGMGISLSTKREYFPDGSAFEGVGIAPDMEVPTTAADLRAGKDPVLAEALAMIRARTSSPER
jgi:carboxyl-terminal processing protease